MNTRVAATLFAGAVALTGGACGGDDAKGDLQAFCKADSVIESTDPFSAESAEAAEKDSNQVRSAFAEARKNAPDDIAADAKRVSAVFEGMLDTLEAADFDTAKVDSGELFGQAAARDSEFEPSLERVNVYTAENCNGQ